MRLKDGATYPSAGDGQEKMIRAVGRCALCRLECFDDGEDNSPLGVCGLRVASPVVAAEHGEPGKADVMACYSCRSNDGALHAKLMEAVRRIWGGEPAKPVPASSDEDAYEVRECSRAFSICYPRDWDNDHDALFSSMIFDMGAQATDEHLGTIHRVEFEDDRRSSAEIKAVIRRTLDRCAKAPASIAKDAAYHEENLRIGNSGGWYNDGHHERTVQAGRNVRQWLARNQDGKEAADRAKHAKKEG